MAKLKDLFLEIDDAPPASDDAIEVYADSVKHALELAATDFNLDVTMLDYEIIKKGTKGLFGFGRQPYIVLVRPFETSDVHSDLDELESKLSGEHMPELTPQEPKDIDGSFKIRVTKSGIFLTSNPPKGTGKPVDIMELNNKLYSMRLTDMDMGKVEKVVKKASGKPVKIGDWKPDPQNDGSMRIEVTEDEMKAYAYFTPPRFAGRHMEYDEVLDAFKAGRCCSWIERGRN
jgi:predicted RNA-binding protein Jag